MKSWNLWESRGSWKKSWDQEPNLQSLFFIIWGGDLSTLILIPYMMTTNCWIYWLLAIYWLDTLSWLQFLGLQPPISNVFWGQHEFQPSCLQWRVKHHRPPFFRRRCSQLLVKKIQRNWYIYIYTYIIYIYNWSYIINFSSFPFDSGLWGKSWDIRGKSSTLGSWDSPCFLPGPPGPTWRNISSWHIVVDLPIFPICFWRGSNIFPKCSNQNSIDFP